MKSVIASESCDVRSLDSGTVRSVERICRIFSALSPQGVTLTELANRTGLSLPTVGRLLMTARSMGYVERTSDSRYVPGPAFLSVAYSMDQDGTIYRVVREAIESLRDEIDETVGFYVREGTERYCVDSAESRRAVRRVHTIGHRRPYFLGAAGTVLVAFGDTARLLSNFPDDYELSTGAVLTLDELRRSCEVARKKGYAFCPEQIDREAWGLAAPVYASGVLFGALTVSGPMTRVDLTYIEACAASCRRVSETLSKKLSATFVGHSGAIRPRRAGAAR